MELSGQGATARDSLALSLVVDAQTRGEPVAWVGGRRSCFFPPDAAWCGVDLDALAVVLLQRPGDLPKAVDLLVRSGAFGLIVLDLERERVAPALQSRIAGLAKKHGTAVLCLTEKSAQQPSLGPLVSLRGEVRRERLEKGRWQCTLEVQRDRRRGACWEHREEWDGPPGLC